MPIRVVAFDIGGVLEITPRTDLMQKWEQTLLLKPGELDARLHDVWQGGSIGTISEADVHRQIGAILEINPGQVNAFMDDVWKDYLGELNVELTDFFKSLRPQYRTAIISNSFVGAREKEQARYRFEDMTELIIYSHEVGISKPDHRIYELTCQRLGVQPSEMIFVDDVEPNVIAAREVGMKAVLFRDNAQTIAEIRAHLA